MQQATEIQRDLQGSMNGLTVVSTDRSAFLVGSGGDLVCLLPACPRCHSVASLDEESWAARGDSTNASPPLRSPSLPRLRKRSHRQAQYRSSRFTVFGRGHNYRKNSAEAHDVHFANLVYEINPSVGGRCAACITTNQKTEQRRCTAV